MEMGVVKFFDEIKKWGFIARNNGEKDIFVHLSSLSEGLHTLVPDSLVQFTVGKGRTGQDQAKDVFVVKEPEPNEEGD